MFPLLYKKSLLQILQRAGRLLCGHRKGGAGGHAFLNFYGGPPLQAAKTFHCDIHYGVSKSLLIPMYLFK